MENTTETCLICDYYQAITHNTDVDNEYIHQTCPRCLEFKISKKVIPKFKMNKKSKNNNYLIHVLIWMIKNNQLDEIPILTDDVLVDCTKSNEPTPSFNDRTKYLLQEIISKYKLKPSFSEFEFKSNINFATISFSRNTEEAFLLLQYLTDLSLIQRQPCKNGIKSEAQYEITPQGYAYLENSNTICVLCKNKNIHSNEEFYYYSCWFNLNEIIVINKSTDSDGYHQKCPYCGEFKISQATLDLLSYQHDSEYDQDTKEVEDWISVQNSRIIHLEMSRTAFDLYEHQQINTHDQYLKKILQSQKII